MSDGWGVDVTDWWLDNGEGYKPVIKSLRDFIQFRTIDTQEPDAKDASVRDMNGIFKDLKLSTYSLPGQGTETVRDESWWHDQMSDSSPDHVQ
jgi:hypothetical protein